MEIYLMKMADGFMLLDALYKNVTPL